MTAMTTTKIRTHQYHIIPHNIVASYNFSTYIYYTIINSLFLFGEIELHCQDCITGEYLGGKGNKDNKEN